MLTKSRHPQTQSLQDLQAYFRTLSDAARLEILDVLAASTNYITVGDIARRLDISQPLCSWHVRSLVKLGVVRIQRVGREARCSLNRERLQEYERAFKNWLALR